MKLGSAAAEMPALGPGLAKLCTEAEAPLDNARVDLAVVFFTSHFEDEAPAAVSLLTRRYPSAVIVGCAAEGVIGPQREHERVPSGSLFLASLPDVRLRPFAVDAEQIGGLRDADMWVAALDIGAMTDPVFLFFGDPYTVPINPILDFFNQAYPNRPVFGGMVSGCERRGQAVMLIDDKVQRDGVVGVALSGKLDVRAVVSQGCRPIGKPFVITKAEGNVVFELGGGPALRRLREVIESLSPRDIKLAEEALFLGQVINEYQPSFDRGDFLIRNLIGLDPRSGAIAAGDTMRVGATVQFHVRDRTSADEDLRSMLAPYEGSEATAGALLFSCNGRGTRMWPEPNHDVGVLREICGPISVGGFFAAGEIGPVGGRNFIHGHTASIAVFRDPNKARKKTPTEMLP
jgi:small ligand-binding sensory domain FIST